MISQVLDLYTWTFHQLPNQGSFSRVNSASLLKLTNSFSSWINKITPQNKCEATNKKREYKSTQLHALEKIVILPRCNQLFCCYIYTVYCIPPVGEPEEVPHEVINSFWGGGGGSRENNSRHRSSFRAFISYR